MSHKIRKITYNQNKLNWSLVMYMHLNIKEMYYLFIFCEFLESK